jgi:flagellar biogenesis protein FliO
MEWILVKTLLSLIAVIALMFGVVYVLRKYVYQGSSGNSSLVAVDILGQRSLHPKRSIIVLKVLHTILVVGMSEQGMQTLATIDDERSLGDIEGKLNGQESKGRWMQKGASNRGLVQPEGFAGQLQDVMKAFSNRRPRVNKSGKKGGKTA